MMEILLLGGAIALTALVGASWTRRQGAVRGPRFADGQVDWASQGVDLGRHVTFVQFSAQVCAACRSTARVLGTMAARDGVVHHELDVEDTLALTGRLGILRTPTVLVLDQDGAEVARMSGAVSPAQAREALARATGPGQGGSTERAAKDAGRAVATTEQGTTKDAGRAVTTTEQQVATDVGRAVATNGRAR